MKSKSTLIPKRKMWISFTFIFLPVLILVFLKLFNFNEYLDSDKLLKTYGQYLTHWNVSVAYDSMD